MKSNQRRKALAKLAREQRLAKRLQAIDGTVVELGTKSKMRNIKTTYRGHKYDSLGEAEYAAHLDWLVQAGDVLWWERQCPVVVLDAPTARDRIKMIVDFKVQWLDGVTYEDFKGRILPVFMLKAKLWKQHVAEPLYVVTRGAAGSFDRRKVA